MIMKMAERIALVVLILCLVQWPDILADVCPYLSGGVPVYHYCGDKYECCAELSTKCCKREEKPNIYVIAIGCTVGGSLIIALVVGAMFYCIVKNKKRANVGPGTEMNFVRHIHVTEAPLPPTYRPMESYQPPSYEDVHSPSVPLPASRFDGGNVQKVEIR